VRWRKRETQKETESKTERMRKRGRVTEESLGEIGIARERAKVGKKFRPPSLPPSLPHGPSPSFSVPPSLSEKVIAREREREREREGLMEREREDES
jgi:hypothetical protein